jgi:hypothetical protein
LTNSLDLSLHYHSTFEIHMTPQVSTRQHLHPRQLTCPWLEGAYPDPDSPVQYFFVSEELANTKTEAAARYCAFLCALFNGVQDALRHYESPNFLPLPEWWYRHLLCESSITPGEMANNRQILYEKAVNDHKPIFVQIQDLATQPPLTSEDTPTIHRVAKNMVAESAKQLQARVAAITGDPLIIMYFDESHTLFKHPLRDKATRYAALCLALDHLSTTQIFSIFLSTDSSLSRYVPHADIFSVRLSGVNKLQSPFTELPFDCHPGFPISQGQYTLQKSGVLGFLCRFGRPLFVHAIRLFTHAACEFDTLICSTGSGHDTNPGSTISTKPS